MKTLEYRTADKSDWGDGPWMDEPDKKQWCDPVTGLPCLIVRNTHVTGSLCGYVGLTREHPLYGKGYTEAPDIDVHGGLTFSNKCRPDAEVDGICHVVEPGENDDVWWFGFDCGHGGDIMPGMDATRRKMAEATGREFHSLRFESDTYKTIAYVEQEVQKLARQLIEAQHG